MKTPVPERFTGLFRELAVALQPRDLQPDAREIYYNALVQLGEAKLTAAAGMLKRRRYFPTTAEWYAEAMRGNRSHIGLPPGPRCCRRCGNRGLIVVRYQDGAPFDLAICDCAEGQRLRRLGVDGVAQYVATGPGGRIRVTAANQIGYVEDFAEVTATNDAPAGDVPASPQKGRHC